MSENTLLKKAKALIKEKKAQEPKNQMMILLQSKDVKSTARALAKAFSKVDARKALNDLLREEKRLPVINDIEKEISTVNFNKLLPTPRKTEVKV